MGQLIAVPVNRAAPTPDPNEVSRGFGSTEWSLVLAAGKDDSASDALGRMQNQLQAEGLGW